MRIKDNVLFGSVGERAIKFYEEYPMFQETQLDNIPFLMLDIIGNVSKRKRIR
jgi:hypothetical protein